MTAAALVTIISAARALVSLIKESREILKQRGELTPEAEAKLDELITALQDDSTKPAHWRIDP
jgi:hypothetical protein